MPDDSMVKKVYEWTPMSKDQKEDLNTGGRMMLKVM